MKGSVDYVGQVTGGRISDAMAILIGKAIKMFDGKNIKISVSERKRNRSLSQNAYYWGVVIPAVLEMFRDAGNAVDEDEVHSYLKKEIGRLSTLINLPDGEVALVPRSTKHLDTMAFEGYLDRVRAWAASMGCIILMPNETPEEPTPAAI